MEIGQHFQELSQPSCVKEFLQVTTWYLAIEVIGNEMKTASVTLAISPCPVAAAAYLHSGQLQIQRVRISSSGRLESDITVPMLESDSTVGQS